LENPYKTLGVKENASEEEIKKAYRDMVKKYHPDQYRNNPLSKLAEERLAEINEAYDYITKNRFSGRSWNTGGQTNSRNWSTSGDFGGDPEFSNISSNINSGNLDYAETLLNRISNRNAKWYYLMGVLNLKRGRYDVAYSHIENAVNMDPGNDEYRNTLNRMNMSNSTYRNNAYNSGYGGDANLCNTCSCLCCADSCCECMGGDCIPCC